MIAGVHTWMLAAMVIKALDDLQMKDRPTNPSLETSLEELKRLTKETGAIEATETPPEEKVLLKDCPLGTVVDFGEGHRGTVIGLGSDWNGCVLIGYENDAQYTGGNKCAPWSMNDSSTGISVQGHAAAKPKSFALDNAKYPFAWWHNENIKVKKLSMGQKPEQVVEENIADIPIGSVVENQRFKNATIVAKCAWSNNGATDVLLAWKKGGTPDLSAWGNLPANINTTTSRKVLNGEEVLGNNERTVAKDLLDYEYGYWIAGRDKFKVLKRGNTPTVSSNEMELAKVPIGSVIQFEDGEKATVVGRYDEQGTADCGGVLLAWKEQAPQSSKRQSYLYFTPRTNSVFSKGVQEAIDGFFSTRRTEIASNLLDYESACWENNKKVRVRIISRPSSPVPVMTNKPQMVSANQTINTKNLCDLPVGTKVSFGLNKGVIDFHWAYYNNGEIDRARIKWHDGSSLLTTIERDNPLAKPTSFTVESTPDKPMTETVQSEPEFNVDIKSVPLGTEVELENGDRGVIVGRSHAQRQVCLGRKDTKFDIWSKVAVPLSGDEFIDIYKKDYHQFSWRSSDNQSCRVIKEADPYTTNLKDVPIGSEVEYQIGKTVVRATVVGRFSSAHGGNSRVAPTHIALASQAKVSVPGVIHFNRVGKETLVEAEMAKKASCYELAPNYKDFEYGFWHYGSPKCKIITRGNDVFIKPQPPQKVSKEKALELANLMVRVGSIGQAFVDQQAKGIEGWSTSDYDRNRKL